MLTISVVLYLIGNLAFAAFAAKYSFGPAPTDFHSDIMRAGGTEIDETLRNLFAAINQVLGGCFFALALAGGFLAIFGVYQNLLWAKVATVAIAAVSGMPSTVVAFRMEQKTKVRTPWRVGAALMGITLVAFILAII